METVYARSVHTTDSGDATCTSPTECATETSTIVDEKFHVANEGSCALLRRSTKYVLDELGVEHGVNADLRHTLRNSGCFEVCKLRRVQRTGRAVVSEMNCHFSTTKGNGDGFLVSVLWRRCELCR